MNEMTFGEMRAWTNRLNNILEAGGELKNDRLISLKKDLEIATDIKSEPCAARLHLTVTEEARELS